tara:strand:+ start:399 stop:812 length:414 start_codon:yes stop_codon:yes gene_type:complete
MISPYELAWVRSAQPTAQHRHEIQSGQYAPKRSKAQPYAGARKVALPIIVARAKPICAALSPSAVRKNGKIVNESAPPNADERATATGTRIDALLQKSRAAEACSDRTRFIAWMKDRAVAGEKLRCSYRDLRCQTVK